MLPFWGKDDKLKLPKQNLLFYTRTPNDESILWNEATTWDEYVLWSGWSLPVSCYAAVGVGFWFSGETTPIVHTGTEILSWEWINKLHVIFSITRGLAVYAPTLVAKKTLTKAYKYEKVAIPAVLSYPSRYPLYSCLDYNADIDPYADLVGRGHDFNSNILTPQYECRLDGTYGIATPGYPAVDTFADGFKGVRSCGAVTNLIPGDTSIARSVTLSAQSYTLQVIGSGTATCSYGTATVSTPLTFTATAGATLFTPTGATLWMLTATAYPVPYAPPGVTQSASFATATNGTWFTDQLDSELYKALTGSPFTLATRIRMGVGSADLPLSSAWSILIPNATTFDLSGIAVVADGTSRISRASDGSTAQYINSAWPRYATIQRFTQVNTAGNRFRVGYMIEGTHTTIQWSHPSEDSTTWAVYDGSFNPSTLYRLMFGYNNPYSMWLNKMTAWKSQVSVAELEAWA